MLITQELCFLIFSYADKQTLLRRILDPTFQFKGIILPTLGEMLTFLFIQLFRFNKLLMKKEILFHFIANKMSVLLKKTTDFQTIQYQNPRHIETSQMSSKANQLTSFYMKEKNSCKSFKASQNIPKQFIIVVAQYRSTKVAPKQYRSSSLQQFITDSFCQE